MRRRRSPGRDQEHPNVPRELLRFDPGDWADAPGEFYCEHPECRYWEAVGRWMAEHPGAELAADGPDTPFHPERV